MRCGAKSPPWNSHELTYPQPFSPPGPAGPQKVNFCSENHFLAPNRIFAALLELIQILFTELTQKVATPTVLKALPHTFV